MNDYTCKASSRAHNTREHHKLMAVLNYTVNPQPDGTSAPYVALPIDYFPDTQANRQHRRQQAEKWFPKMYAWLNAGVQNST